MSTSAVSVANRPTQRARWLREMDQRMHRAKAAHFLSVLSPYIPKGASILDIGAGDGLLSASLAESVGGTVRAIDVEARQLSSHPVEVFDGERIPLPDWSVDYSICVFVLHHCRDLAQQAKLLKDIRRVTRKRFLIVEDRCDSAFDRFAVIGFHHYLNLIETMPFDPAGFASTSQWEDRLGAAGFRVVAATPIGRCMKWLPIHNTLIVSE